MTAFGRDFSRDFKPNNAVVTREGGWSSIPRTYRLNDRRTGSPGQARSSRAMTALRGRNIRPTTPPLTKWRRDPLRA